MKHILFIDDEIALCTLFSDFLSSKGYGVSVAHDIGSAYELIQENHFDLILSDIRMPNGTGIELLSRLRDEGNDIPFLLMTAYAAVKDAVSALKLGAIDYLEKPIDFNELLTRVQTILQDTSSMNDDLFPAHFSFGDAIVESPLLRAVYADAYRIAQSDVSVLITGESGTGKELLAHFIHAHSHRANRSYIAVNCAAISPNLMESELFGHKKGAFTGATSDRNGRFKEAHGGTLFLDEIGDMPLPLQAALLRALQNGVITPVGSDIEEKVDCRLIAATHKNLDQAIEDKLFREDLYYRLNVIHLEIPPLRERREDILALARAFLKKHDPQKHFSSAVVRMLQSYDWPGNVRELSNAIDRVAILSRSSLIMPEHLPIKIVKFCDAMPEKVETTQDAIRTLREDEIASIRRAMNQTNHNQTRAAALLGISRRTLINKLKLMQD